MERSGSLGEGFICPLRSYLDPGDISSRIIPSRFCKGGRAISKIMLIRHAEKPPDDDAHRPAYCGDSSGPPPPYGVMENGSQSWHSLSVRGWQRAGALVNFFAFPTNRAIAIPERLFACDARGESLRPQETLRPLARQLDLSIDLSCTVDGEAALAEILEALDTVVLVAWEHKHIPLIAKRILPTTPTSWPNERFDVIWVLDGDNGNFSFTEVNQSLLDGDVR